MNYSQQVDDDGGDEDQQLLNQQKTYSNFKPNSVQNFTNQADSKNNSPNQPQVPPPRRRLSDPTIFNNNMNNRNLDSKVSSSTTEFSASSNDSATIGVILVKTALIMLSTSVIALSLIAALCYKSNRVCADIDFFFRDCYMFTSTKLFYIIPSNYLLALISDQTAYNLVQSRMYAEHLINWEFSLWITCVALWCLHPDVLSQQCASWCQQKLQGLMTNRCVKICTGIINFLPVCVLCMVLLFISVLCDFVNMIFKVTPQKPKLFAFVISIIHERIFMYEAQYLPGRYFILKKTEMKM